MVTLIAGVWRVAVKWMSLAGDDGEATIEDWADDWD